MSRVDDPHPRDLNVPAWHEGNIPQNARLIGGDNLYMHQAGSKHVTSEGQRFRIARIEAEVQSGVAVDGRTRFERRRFDHPSDRLAAGEDPEAGGAPDAGRLPPSPRGAPRSAGPRGPGLN